MFALVSIFGYQAFTLVNDEIQADTTIANESKAQLDDLHTNYPSIFDGIFIFVLVALWLSAIVFSLFIDAHPIFLAISIILITFILVLGAYLTNAYEAVTLSDEISATTSNFPMTTFVFAHLLETILMISASIVISLYAKNQ